MFVGTVWKANTWAADTWAADTWADASAPTPTLTRSATGGSTGVRHDDNPRVPAAADVGVSAPAVWGMIGKRRGE